jgi:molybdopterin molybdotransferase
MSQASLDKLMTVAEAIGRIDRTPVPQRTERLSLPDARGRTLAQEIRADRDAPPFDRSLMDGFAVHIADVSQPPVELRLAGEIPAGRAAERALQPGEAMKIMTGAPLPPGADGVVPVEEVEGGSFNTSGAVRILRAPDPRRYISRRGSDCRAGEVVLSRGTRLTPAAIGVAASVGAAEVSVFARPSVSILTTGDEIVGIGQTPTGAQIRNSNGAMLVALCESMGCRIDHIAHASDDPRAIRDALDRSADSDIVFVTGGMSMGEFDYVPGVLRDAGFAMHIAKLRIKPGKPFVFATRGDDAATMKYVFGLPGNPVSGFVCTVRLASRLIRRMQGLSPEPAWRSGRIESPVGANGGREFYQPVRMEDDRIIPLGWKGSADVYTLARASGLLIREANAPELPAGSIVRVMEVPS